MRHDVDPDAARCAALLHLEGEETRVASDFEHALRAEIGGNPWHQRPPAARRVVAAVRIRPDAGRDLDVLIPRPEFGNAPIQIIAAGHATGAIVCCPPGPAAGMA